MREILFRGKSVDTGKWVYGYLARVEYYITDGAEVSIIIPTDATLYPRCEISSYEIVISETVGQWTGLVDKNGTKIFEGDIMRNAGNVVEYCSDGFCINGDCPLAFWKETEVIGNIHDNP